MKVENGFEMNNNCVSYYFKVHMAGDINQNKWKRFQII